MHYKQEGTAYTGTTGRVEPDTLQKNSRTTRNEKTVKKQQKDILSPIKICDETTNN